MVRIALGQLNTTVGDLDGNVERLADAAARATAEGADVVVFPELAITGYPPEDLVLRSGVRDRQPRRARRARLGDRRAGAT